MINGRQSEFVTCKGMAISPQLQLELEKVYLTFLLDLMFVETKEFMNPIPDTFVKEIAKAAKTIWPGLSPVEYFKLFTSMLEDFKKRKLEKCQTK